MASAAATADARRAHAGARGIVRRLEPSEVAWIGVLPCALVTLLLVVLLGPALGDALLRPDPAREAFWPDLAVVAEPTQHGRFLAGLLGPLLLTALVLAAAHPRARLPRLRAGAIATLVRAGQATLFTFVLGCFAAQYGVVLNADFPSSPHVRYFDPATLLTAAALPALALGLALPRAAGLRERLGALAREARARRRACLLAAVLYTALWLLTALNVDNSIGAANPAVSAHLPWTMGEAFAVLNGRTPLVDFHAQYGQVWAYLAAGPMALLGRTIATYSLVMVAGSALALLAAYATLRRAARSSVAALALFGPFLATVGFMVVGPPDNRYESLNLYSLWPIRYGGPFVLLWLTARHLDQAAPRRAWPLFALAGLVAVNSMDFGLAAGAATLAALAAATPVRSWRAAGRLAGTAAGGALAAVALCSLLTLLRAGELPRFGLLLEFGRLYGIGGWAQLPMPVLGLHLAVFLTFAATLVLAAVRIAAHEPDRLMTGLLAWIGAFGLAASVYYVGRAHPFTLFPYLAPWAFAVALLAIVVVRELAARGWPRPTLPQLAVLFALGLAACSLAQTPPPGPQLARLRAHAPDPLAAQREAVQLVRATTRPGEPVEVLTQLGHRVAHDAGVVNVSPYTSIESMPTRQQLARALTTLRAADGTKVYLPIYPPFLEPNTMQAVQDAGFAIGAYSRTRAYVELVRR